MIKINIEEDRSYETVVITDHTEDDYYKLCSALFTITRAALRQNFTPEQIKSAMEYAEEVVRKARREIQEKNKRKVLHVSIDIEGALKCPKDFIGCKKCNLYFGIEIENGCELYDGWRATFPDKETAIEAWNTRTDINPEKNCKESENWCADCGHIEMCRWYPTMGCCFKETTEKLFDTHLEECRQLALYDDELKKALALLRRVKAVHSAAIRNGDAAVSSITSRLLYDIEKLEGEI